MAILVQDPTGMGLGFFLVKVMSPNFTDKSNWPERCKKYMI
jgi:hypothetical protein